MNKYVKFAIAAAATVFVGMWLIVSFTDSTSPQEAAKDCSAVIQQVKDIANREVPDGVQLDEEGVQKYTETYAKLFGQLPHPVFVVAKYVVFDRSGDNYTIVTVSPDCSVQFGSISADIHIQILKEMYGTPA